MQKAAEGLRLAVDVGRGARGQKARAQLSTWLTLPGGQYRTLMPRVPSPVVLHLAVDDVVRRC